MPSRWTTGVARDGPRGVLWAFVGLALLWAGLRTLLGPFLSTRTRVLFGVAALGAFSALQLFQGAFMLAYPGVAVREGIEPPQTRGNQWADLNPGSKRKAKRVGVLAVVGSLFGFLVTALFASAL